MKKSKLFACMMLVLPISLIGCKQKATKAQNLTSLSKKDQAVQIISDQNINNLSETTTIKLIADNNTISPSEQIIQKGQIVQILLSVDNDNTHYSGLIFKSEELFEKDVLLKPGEEKIFTTEANSDISIKSYWPNSNILKGEALITVY